MESDFNIYFDLVTILLILLHKLRVWKFDHGQQLGLRPDFELAGCMASFSPDVAKNVSAEKQDEYPIFLI